MGCTDLCLHVVVPYARPWNTRTSARACASGCACPRSPRTSGEASPAWAAGELDEGPPPSATPFLLRIGDADMPADFLTKWLSKKKLEASLRRATNAANAVPASNETES